MIENALEFENGIKIAFFSRKVIKQWISIAAWKIWKPRKRDWDETMRVT
jgi:hypothetical protein